jgi:hypothetical protein
VDDGMNNMIARVFTGLKTITGLTVDLDLGKTDKGEPFEGPPEVTEQACRRAMSRLERCVVGMQNDDFDETENMVEHWFPWIQMKEASNNFQYHLYHH